MIFRVYSAEYERICIRLYPCNHVGQGINLDEIYAQKPLKIYLDDYRTLLLPYLTQVFPVENPLDGTLQTAFDECFDNWIAKAHWPVIIDAIRHRLQDRKSGVSALEREFYENFIEWVEDKLERFNMIVVEGNL